MAGTTVNPYRFGGQVGYRQDSVSTQYVRARHLDTSKGRWVSRDPIGFEGGHVNLYAYVENNPVMRIDPSGLLSWNITYGHFCGPQTKAGKPPPINKVDACCQTHDNCWERSKCTFAKGSWGARSGPCKTCNDALCACIKAHPCPSVAFGLPDPLCSLTEDIVLCGGGCTGAAYPKIYCACLVI